MTAELAKRLKAFPVMEVFGPTIQGEGNVAGLPTYFVRIGGCDYRCSWCDSLHAVIPAEVRAHSEKLTSTEILARITALPKGPEWVTLSGGNPALLELGPLVRDLRDGGYKVAVETQGSKWRDWLATVNCLTISPKPPSSGMSSKVEEDLAGFMFRASIALPERRHHALKIVAFDEGDLDFAVETFLTYPTWPRFLSCGTVVGEPIEELAMRYRWLCTMVAHDDRLPNVRVLPQLHVIAWGHVKGV